MEKGKYYLVETNWGIAKCKCVSVTKKCYEITWDSGASIWLYRTEFKPTCLFPPKYKIIECLG